MTTAVRWVVNRFGDLTDLQARAKVEEHASMAAPEQVPALTDDLWLGWVDGHLLAWGPDEDEVRRLTKLWAHLERKRAGR